MDWPSVELKDLVEPDRGISYGIVQPGSPALNGVPIVRVSDVRDGRISISDPLKVAPEIESQYSRTRLRGGELLLTIVGTVGETAIVPATLAGWNTARAIAVIPVRDDVGAYWLRLALRAPTVRSMIDSRLNTTVQATLNLGDVARLPILFPPAPERKRIIRVLGSLDDKIDLNRRMNELLDAMARAIFKDWFVDFSPTRTKMESREPYLAADLWDLFPEALDDVGKPVGWSEGTLAALAELNPESWTRNTYPDQIRYVDLSNTKWGTVESTAGHDKKSAPSRAQRILRTGDTIVGTVRPGNGSYAFIGEDGLTGSTGFAVLRPKHPNQREFVYMAATSTENIERLTHLADGGAYPAVRPEAVIATPVLGFDETVLSRFSDLTKPLLEEIEANKRESRTLAETRDLLLPKLMSGEIKIEEAL